MARLYTPYFDSDTAGAAGGAGSVTSAEAQAISAQADSANLSILAGISAVSGRSTPVATASVHGLQSIVNALSQRISAVVAGGVSVTSTELSQALSVLSVTDAGLSTRIDTQSQAISVLSQAHSALSQAVSVISNVLSNEASVRSAADLVLSNAISQEASVRSNVDSILSQAISVVSNAVSVGDAALSVRVDTQSQAISVLSQAHSVLSQAVSVADAALSVRVDTQSQSISVLSQQVSILSQAHSVLSQAVSVADAALSVRIDTQSQSISALSQQVSALSQAVSVLSQAHSILSQTVSVLSNQVSAVSSRVETVSAASGGGSVHGLQSVINKLSDRISGIVAGGGVSVTSTELSQALSVVSAQAASAINVVSNRISAVSVLDNELTAVDGVQSAFNAVSNRLSAANDDLGALFNSVIVLSNKVSALSTLVFTSVSARSVGDISTKGLQSAINALSGRITGGTGSVTSTELSNALSQLSVTDAGLSNRVQSVVDRLSGDEGSFLSTLSILSATGNLIGFVNGDASALSAGQAIALMSLADNIQKADADGTSGRPQCIGLMRTKSVPVSGVGEVQFSGSMILTTAQWDEVTGQAGGLTPGAPYYLDVTPGKLTTTPPATGVVRLVGVASSTTVMVIIVSDAQDWTSHIKSVASAVSTNLSLVASVLSQAISAGDAGLSSRVDSVQSAVSNHESILSNVSAVSGAGVGIGLQNVINALSNRISNQVSARFNDISNALSNDASIWSAVSVLRSAISARSAGTSVSVRGMQSIIDTLSQKISVVGGGAFTSVSATSIVNGTSVQGAQSVINQLSSRYGQVFARNFSAINTVTATTLTDITSMLLSLEASAVYIIDAAVLMDSNSGGKAIGISLPALAAAGAYFEGRFLCAAGNNTGADIGSFAQLPGGAAGNTIIVSTAAATAAARYCQIVGLVYTSAAGTAKLMAKTSAAAQVMSIRGAYLRAVRIF